MGYDFDLIVDNIEEMPLVVSGELYGPLLREQLDRRLGSISPTAVRAVASAVWTDAASLTDHQRGTPLEPDDVRRSFITGLLDPHDQMCAPAREDDR